MKKILIVSSTFFPDKTVGAIRVSQWAKHLPEFGWEPHIACRYYGVESEPEELKNSINSQTTIHYLDRPTKTAPNGSTKKRKNPIKGWGVKLLQNFAVPDVSIWTWKGLAPKIEQIIQDVQPDALLTSSPPHSIHHVGIEMVQKSGLPWIADFRDPFLVDSRYQPKGIGKLAQGRYRQFESEIVEHASRCVTAIPLHHEWLCSRYPEAKSSIMLIPNGFPAEMIEGLSNTKKTPNKKMRIVVAGVISQDAISFFENLVSLGEASNLAFEFFHYGPKPEISNQDPPDKNLHFCGKVPHEQAISAISEADVLMVFSSKSRAATSGLSSKLFEYLATGKPIVAIRPTKPDENLLADCSWSVCFTDPDLDRVLQHLQKVQNQEIPFDEDWLMEFRKKYNRRSQTGLLADSLGQVVAGN